MYRLVEEGVLARPIRVVHAENMKQRRLTGAPIIDTNSPG
jgi:hypothetical protein